MLIHSIYPSFVSSLTSLNDSLFPSLNALVSKITMIALIALAFIIIICCLPLCFEHLFFEKKQRSRDALDVDDRVHPLALAFLSPRGATMSLQEEDSEDSSPICDDKEGSDIALPSS